MAIPVLPTLQGIAYPVVRTPIWSTIKNEALSGKRARFALWSYPQYRYKVSFQFLRNSPAESQELIAFFNVVSGSAGLFQFNDPDDNTAANVIIAIADGSTTSFQLYRALGTAQWYDPVFAITGSPVVMVNGLPVSDFSLSTIGVVTFTSPPAAGAEISWSGTYNWYCRFDDDTADFEKWLSTFYRQKQLVFTTEKYLQ